MYFDADQRKKKNNGVTIDEAEPFDAEQALIDKRLIHNVIVTQFGNAKNVQWLDSEDPMGLAEGYLDKNEKAATAQLKAAYEHLVPGAKTSE